MVAIVGVVHSPDPEMVFLGGGCSQSSLAFRGVVSFETAVSGALNPHWHPNLVTVIPIQNQILPTTFAQVPGFPRYQSAALSSCRDVTSAGETDVANGSGSSELMLSSTVGPPAALACVVCVSL